MQYLPTSRRLEAADDVKLMLSGVRRMGGPNAVICLISGKLANPAIFLCPMSLHPSFVLVTIRVGPIRGCQ